MLDCTQTFATWRDAQELGILLCINRLFEKESNSRPQLDALFADERVFVLSQRVRSKARQEKTAY